MSTEQTNSHDEPKKPRKGSKIAKRIAELETDYALAFAEGRAGDAVRIRTAINRLENGESEEAPAVDASEPLIESSGPIADTAPATTWNDVVAASADAEASKVTREQTFDKIRVDLTPEERLALGQEYIAADRELAALAEEKKEAMADLKARITKVETKKRETGEAYESGKQWREAGKDGWICVEAFATNTRTYLDPKTERVMCVEAITGSERAQMALPLTSTESAEKAAQLSLGDVEPTDAADMTDPESLLAAAQKGDEVTPSNVTLENDEADEGDGDDDLDEDD